MDACNVLVTHPSVPISNVREFIAFLKIRPGQVLYGSAGSGSSTHLAAELFKNLAAVDMLHVPYRGAADSVIALLGGQVHVMFAALPTALPHIRTGRLKGLGVTGEFPGSLCTTT